MSAAHEIEPDSSRLNPEEQLEQEQLNQFGFNPELLEPNEDKFKSTPSSSNGLMMYRLEEAFEKAMPYLVAVLCVVMIIVFPMSISNFHNLHSSSLKGPGKSVITDLKFTKLRGILTL